MQFEVHECLKVIKLRNYFLIKGQNTERLWVLIFSDADIAVQFKAENRNRRWARGQMAPTRTGRLAGWKSSIDREKLFRDFIFVCAKQKTFARWKMSKKFPQTRFSSVSTRQLTRHKNRDRITQWSLIQLIWTVKGKSLEEWRKVVAKIVSSGGGSRKSSPLTWKLCNHRRIMKISLHNCEQWKLRKVTERMIDKLDKSIDPDLKRSSTFNGTETKSTEIESVRDGKFFFQLDNFKSMLSLETFLLHALIMTAKKSFSFSSAQSHMWWRIFLSPRSSDYSIE